MQISLAQILSNPQNPRQYFDEEELGALADSLEAHGLLNSVSLEGPYEGLDRAYYITLDGERRIRAARRLGWETIEATVRPLADGDEKTRRLILALIGNIHRAEMGPVDEARAFAKLRETMTLSEIAQTLGYSVSNISHKLRLIDEGELAEEVLDYINRKKIPLDYKMLRRLRELTEDQQITIARRAVAGKLPASSIITICTRLLHAHPFQRRPNKKAPQSPMSTIAPALAVSGVVLSDRHAEVVEAIIPICEKCGMSVDNKGAICRDCPLSSLARALANSEPEKQEDQHG